MRIQIHRNHTTQPGDVRELIDRRLRRTLGRFRDSIRRLRLQITDDNGPRGGLDKTCCIEVLLIPSGRLSARGTDTNATLAAGKAMDRLAQRLSRYKARSQTRHRRHGAVHEVGRAS